MKEMPRLAVGPSRPTHIEEAIQAGGGIPVSLHDETAQGLIWLKTRDVDGLRHALSTLPSVSWVQLASAGVESLSAANLLDNGRLWTCAKGAYAEPVAEHALALALAGLRQLPERVVARSWGSPGGRSLVDESVVILGGGGISEYLLALLAPFRARVTVVRRRTTPVEGAYATVTSADLNQVLPEALVVFLALALTPATTGIIGKEQLQLMDRQSWLINVARGAHVDTPSLVEALSHNLIGGAALDVCDPEPLPVGHPLWRLQNCIITPHTADTADMIRKHLVRRIRDNVAHFAAGESLLGVVDPSAGY